jgi:hypothetical protein
VLPGYPASHGCIRMPMNFAVKMWGWTRMGARVVVTPGELAPESFSHPQLIAQKTISTSAPAAAAEPQNNIAVTAKSDKAVVTDAAIGPAFSGASLELKSTVGHDTAVSSGKAVSTALRGQTHTADASAALSEQRSSVIVTDAVANNPAMKPAAGATAIASEPATNRVAADSDAKVSDVPSTESKPEATDADAKRVEVVTSDDQADSPKPAAITAAEIKAADADASDKAASAEVPPADEPAKSEPVTAENAQPEAAKQQVKAAGKADAVTPDIKKDQARPSDPEKVTPKPDPVIAAAPKRSGQIAVFVSKKDGKLYVRQNFAPLFDVPIAIAPSDRPLGTHVFTAQTDKDDANLLHWSVVSMPVVARQAARQDDDERASRRRKTTGAIEVKPAPVPDSAAEALDRLTIPADAMARIAEALSTGGSIIVSDQGINAGETGEGTDFIIPLR